MTRFDRTRQKTAAAQRLHRTATPAERILWSKLGGAQVEGASFRRLHPMGPCVPDFCCPTLSLAVELDGGQHGSAAGIKGTLRRDAWPRGRGVQVVRFWNSDIFSNLTGVLEEIRSVVRASGSPEITTKPSATRSAPPTDLPLLGGGESCGPSE